MKNEKSTFNHLSAVAISAILLLWAWTNPSQAQYAYDVPSENTVTEAAALSGTASLTKTGDGLLILSGANKSYTGGTFINAGAVQIADAAANIVGSSASSAISLNGGALYADFSATENPTYQVNVGASGGEIRLVNAGTSGRWVTTTDSISGSGTLTLSFGGGNARYQLNANQSGFTGHWVLESEGNNNKYFDLGSSSGFGNASGDNAVTLDKATVLLRAVTMGSGTQGITLTGDGTTRLDVAGNVSAIVAGKISGVYANTLELNLQSTSVLTLNNTGNSWAGNTIIRTTTTSGGSVRLGASGVLPDTGGNISINSGMVLDLNGYNETIGGLDGSGYVRSSSGEAVLGVGANNNSPTYTGIIQDGGGKLSLNKVGSGILSLAGANTYSGNTTISAGTLKINAGGSVANTPKISLTAGTTFNVASATGGFTLGNGQTLAGNGTVIGSMTAGSGSTLSPGNSPGLITVDDLTLADGSTSFFEINGITTAGVDYDVIQSNDTLTYEDGWILQLSFGDISGTHDVQLFDFTGYSGTANAPTIQLVGSGATDVSFDTATGTLTFTDSYAIPEPSSGLMVFLGCLVFYLRQKK